MSQYIQILSNTFNNSGIAVVSFDFSSTFTCPKTNLSVVAQALTITIVLWGHYYYYKNYVRFNNQLRLLHLQLFFVLISSSLRNMTEIVEDSTVQRLLQTCRGNGYPHLVALKTFLTTQTLHIRMFQLPPRTPIQ